ncbi:molybdopterin oxidoreductase family protein [Natronospirillum operosum]|uniref:Molybdopterin oxidoreductase family protein n=1 Tax=Natronospirillum operosum TaxID=2759953 RepID=A0A4Z0WA69_9GAMM|nr:molybdopterin-dependent oxidoreductase [Natronospirillum operosum]TGG91146.1 molybdopterin oxidoreductase family protein [Natronospirillum operosum]
MTTSDIKVGPRQQRSVCPLDCPDACALQVTVDSEPSADGTSSPVITRVGGHPDHPVTRGAICHKVQRFPQRVHSPERVLTPLRRRSDRPKGLGQRPAFDDFEPISWAEACRDIGQRFRDIIRTHGAEAILPYSFYGNMGVLNSESMDRRFFNRLGASKLARTICNSAAAEGYAHTMGATAGVDPEDTPHARLIIIWGCNIVSTNMHQVMLANEARQQGARIVCIDVHHNRTARWADESHILRPGTDAALALGMMHILFRDGLTDDAFLREHALGVDALRAEVQQWTPEHTAAVTGLEVSAIEHLAHLYGTTSPSLLRIGNGLQHHDNGGMIIRTLSCLPALTGQWGRRGGGALKGNGWYAQFNAQALRRPDLHPSPEARTFNMNELGAALLAADPPVQALFVYNSNPVQVTPDQSRVRAGLQRDDLFTVVHDLFLTDTCGYADIVLPATSHFENLDLYKSYWHLYVQLSEPVLPPQGEARSNVQLFRDLAAEMGFTDPCFQDTEEDLVRQALDSPSPYLQGITLESLRTHGWQRLKVPDIGLYPQHIPTASGRIELYSQRLADLGLPPLPAHTPLQEPEGHPYWLITAPNHRFLNSTCAEDEKLQRLEGNTPTVIMHPDTAAREGIATGDRVGLFNERGSVELTAKVAAEVLPETLVTLGLWRDSPEQGLQAVNHLTPSRPADMGGGATFFSTRVSLRPATAA